jgi:hypothetical protein
VIFGGFEVGQALASYRRLAGGYSYRYVLFLGIRTLVGQVDGLHAITGGRVECLNTKRYALHSKCVTKRNPKPLDMLQADGSHVKGRGLASPLKALGEAQGEIKNDSRKTSYILDEKLDNEPLIPW